MRQPFVLTLLAACLSAGWALPAAAADEGSRQTVVLYWSLVNTADKPARDVHLWAVLPGTNRYQEIHDMAIFPKPVEDRIDRLRQRRVMWKLGTVKPAQALTVMVLVQATVKPVHVDHDSKPAETLLPAQRMDYMSDDPEWFQLKEVKKLAGDWVEKPSDDVWARAEQVFRALRTRCKYVLDNKRDPAGYVLKHKQGSCTELSFAFIGMCRSHRIPARMVSGWVNREGDAAAVDTINHRWAEFWDDRCGWVPVDLSRAISHAAARPLTYRPDRYFGTVRGQFLVVRDDGMRRRNKNNWAGFGTLHRGGDIDAERASAWQATGDPAAERQLFLRATDALSGGDEDALIAQLGEWAKAKAPLGRYMMLPLLGADSDKVRRAAARHLAASDNASMAAGLLAIARDTPDADYRSYLVEQVGGMLDHSHAQFRASIVRHIGRSRIEDFRPKLEALVKNDPHWYVRTQASRAITQLDDAKAGDALANDEDD